MLAITESCSTQSKPAIWPQTRFHSDNTGSDPAGTPKQVKDLADFRVETYVHIPLSSPPETPPLARDSGRVMATTRLCAFRFAGIIACV